MWTKDVPTKEGWYFWKKRSNTADPFYMRAYYIAEIDGELSCWEAGTAVEFPKGGWWKSNCTFLGL